MSGRLLSGHDLRQQMQGSVAADRIGGLPRRGGLKDHAPDGSWLQEQKLKSFYEEQQVILVKERVQKQGCLAVGEWSATIGKVLVTRIAGKLWKNFGHTANGGQQWLYPEEALYLMDEGSLEVFYGGVPLSIQQAYSVLLGSTVPVHHYHVFSHLCRYGYVVRRHSHKSGYSVSLKRSRDSPKRTCDQHKLNVELPAISNSSIKKEHKNVYGRKNEKNEKKKIESCSVNRDSELVNSSGYISQRSPEFNGRGWFNARWFTHYDEQSKMNTKQCSIDISNTVPRSVSSGLLDDLSTLCLVGKDWAEWKRLHTKDDHTWLLSSPVCVLWSGDVKPLTHPSQAVSSAGVMKSLKVMENVDCRWLGLRDQKQQVPVIRIVYDVFLPNSQFRKSDPGRPSVCLCIAQQDDQTPTLADIAQVSYSCPQGATLMWSIVDSGIISFYSFNSVDLPSVPDCAISSS